MNYALVFIVGLVVGGTLGVLAMAICVAASSADEDMDPTSNGH